MSIRVRPISTIVRRYTTGAQGAVQDYNEGVANPRRPQNEAAIAAAEVYNAGVQQSIAEGRFVSGLQAAGEEKWKRRTQALGAERYTRGVTVGASDYQANVQPFIAAIESLDLPPRMPRGSPGNIQRVSRVTETLRAVRLGQRR